MKRIHSSREAPEFALGPEEDSTTVWKPVEEMTGPELWLAVTHCDDAQQRRWRFRAWRHCRHEQG